MDTAFLNLEKKQSTYKLFIPTNVGMKINYICQKVSNIEWSGILFFTHEGSMEEDNLVITCKDILVMDIGSSGYTEFDMSPEVINYMADKPELLDAQIGLVHSHHDMPAFFSGTDINTLKEEGKDRNHFVSLIVNNAGTYTAAITRKIKSVRTIQESYNYNSFGDITISNTREYQEEVENTEYFMLDIVKEDAPSLQDIDKRLEVIRKRKETSAMYPYPKGEIKREPASLFTKRELDGINNKQAIECNHMDADTCTTPYAISEGDVEHTLIQLLTGSIIIRDTSKIDIRKWVATMPQVFGERFGTSEEGFKEFKNWADAHCEFLIFNKKPDIEDCKEETNWLSDFAIALHEDLDTLPKNKYIEALKEIVEQWII